MVELFLEIYVIVDLMGEIVVCLVWVVCSQFEGVYWYIVCYFMIGIVLEMVLVFEVVLEVYEVGQWVCVVYILVLFDMC